MILIQILFNSHLFLQHICFVPQSKFLRVTACAVEQTEAVSDQEKKYDDLLRIIFFTQILRPIRPVDKKKEISPTQIPIIRSLLKDL